MPGIFYTPTKGPLDVEISLPFRSRGWPVTLLSNNIRHVERRMNGRRAPRPRLGLLDIV